MKNKFLLLFILISSFSFGQDLWFFKKNSQQSSFLDKAIAQDEIETLVLDPEQLNSFFLEDNTVPRFSIKGKGIIEMPNEFGAKEKFDLQEVSTLSAALSKEYFLFNQERGVNKTNTYFTKGEEKFIMILND